MFVLIWAALLFSVRGSNADTGKDLSVGEKLCSNGSCFTPHEVEKPAEAGLCVVIPCSFTLKSIKDYKTQNMTWFKCNSSKPKCDDDILFHTNENKTVQPEFKGRVSLLEPDLSQKNCSIIINDLTQSDSGSYRIRVEGSVNKKLKGFTFSSRRVNVSVIDLTQKPTVMVPPLTEGQQTTLTCTAPGLCSGSDPTITWTWSGSREKSSHITGSITEFKTENVTSVTQRHRSTLTFNTSPEHHGTKVTCKVSFINSITTEETVTLNVTSDQPGPGAVLPWVVAAVSLIVNVIFIVCLVFLWNTRKKVKPNQEDRTYMSLRRNDLSPEYDVIGQPLK